jgi:signal transduction histidine kinase
MSFARDGTATDGPFSTAQTEYAALTIFHSPLWSARVRSERNINWTMSYTAGVHQAMQSVSAVSAAPNGASYAADIAAAFPSNTPSRDQRVADAEAARIAAEAANRTKAEFLAAMSHELRTPLNAIGGYVELMELGIHGSLTTEQRFDLDRILQCQKHLLGLIGRVLAYAKLDAEAEQYEAVSVPLDDVFAACEALTAPLIRGKQLHVRYIGRQRRLVARADAEKVRQIMLNLVSNAVKFTDPGGHVTIEAAAEGEKVVVRIVDSGCGIRADQIDRVFQPFVQLDTRPAHRHEGTGLGLAISRLLARGMGGDLIAESVSGVGSTFTMSLPAAQTSDGR